MTFPETMEGVVVSDGGCETEIYSQTVTFKSRNFILIPPFLLKPIQDLISKSNGDSREVLVQCVKALNDFDTKHAHNAEYADKVKSKCKYIMFWLYLVSQNNNEIDAVQVTGCNTKKVASELKNPRSCV